MGSLGLTISQEAVTSFIKWDGGTASGTREPTLTCEPPLTCCGSLWKAGARAGVATLVFRDCTFPASPTLSGLPFRGPSPWPRQLSPHKETEAGREAASARGWGACFYSHLAVSCSLQSRSLRSVRKSLCASACRCQVGPETATVRPTVLVREAHLRPRPAGGPRVRGRAGSECGPLSLQGPLPAGPALCTRNRGELEAGVTPLSRRLASPAFSLCLGSGSVLKKITADQLR